MNKIFIIPIIIYCVTTDIYTSETAVQKAFKTLQLQEGTSWIKIKEKYEEIMSSTTHTALQQRTDLAKIHSAFTTLREHFDPLNNIHEKSHQPPQQQPTTQHRVQTPYKKRRGLNIANAAFVEHVPTPTTRPTQNPIRQPENLTVPKALQALRLQPNAEWKTIERMYEISLLAIELSDKNNNERQKIENAYNFLKTAYRK